MRKSVRKVVNAKSSIKTGITCLRAITPKTGPRNDSPKQTLYPSQTKVNIFLEEVRIQRLYFDC